MKIKFQNLCTLIWLKLLAISKNFRHSIDYFHSYVSGATISFIKHWVQDNNRWNLNIVADHLFKIIFNSRLMAKNNINNTSERTQIIMITAYKHSQTDKVIESELDHTASWVNVVDPNWEEIEMHRSL